MMKVDWENAQTIRAKLDGSANLESLLVDAWRRIDDLTARIARLERTDDLIEQAAHTRTVKELLDREEQLHRIAQFQRERDKVG